MFSLPHTLSMLERTPQTLHSILHDVAEEWTQLNEGPETWSPHEVVAHLVHCERVVWVDRLTCVLHGTGDRVFAPVDRTAHHAEGLRSSTPELLRVFAQLRAENVRWLRGLDLSKNELDRTAIHPSLGTVTLRELLAVYLRHDLTHTMQILRVLSAPLHDAIGPWAQRSHYKP